MTIAEMLAQSGVMTLLGISVVFSFITILVFCVMIMGKVFQALAGKSVAQVPQLIVPEKAFSPVEAVAATGSSGTAAIVSSQHIAAITAAIKEYRKS